MGSGYHGGFGYTIGSEFLIFDEKINDNVSISLMDELRQDNIKFNEEDIVFIVRDQSGQIVWLENGNSSAGLIHIIEEKDERSGHAKDFEKAFGITKNEIGDFLKEVVQFGKVVSNKIIDIGNDKQGYERIYEYNEKYCVLTGIGTNGFIVTAYPMRKENL